MTVQPERRCQTRSARLGDTSGGPSGAQLRSWRWCWSFDVQRIKLGQKLQKQAGSCIPRQTVGLLKSASVTQGSTVHGGLSAEVAFVTEAPLLCAALETGWANYINPKQINAWRRLKGCGKWLEIELTFETPNHKL